MMSKEKRRVPKLRFPGFTEDWEQRKLGDYLTIPEKEILEVASVNDLITVKLNLGGVESGASRDTLSLGSTVYYKRYAGQFIYGKQNFFNGSMGLIPKNLDGKGSSGDVPSFNVSNIEANYLYTYVSRESYWRLKVAAASGTGSKRIHEKTFLDFNIDVPSLDEQKLISNTFDLVNRFITLHQRKLNNLKLKKKALLQKLFPKNGERYPELRFSGFTDAWEQRKLSQITVRVTRKNGNQSDLPLTISAQDGLVDQRKYFNRQVASRDMSNYYLIKKGEFAYNKSYSEGYPFGAVKRLEYYDIGALSTLYILFEITDKNISSDFLVSYYMTHLWYKEVSKRAAEGARNHGLLNISTEDFFNSELNIPNSIEEQVKIGNLIKQFDKFITLHQRKLDHLQLQKKALLQQMFV